MTEKDFEKNEKRNYLDCKSFREKPISARTVGEVMFNEGINLDSEAVERAIRKIDSPF